MPTPFDIPEGCLLIEQEQFDRLWAINQELFGPKTLTPDRRRDLANALWLVLTAIRDQNPNAPQPKEVFIP